MSETASGVPVENQTEKVVVEATEIIDTIVDFDSKLGWQLNEDERAAFEYELKINVDKTLQQKGASLKELHRQIKAGNFRKNRAH